MKHLCPNCNAQHETKGLNNYVHHSLHQQTMEMKDDEIARLKERCSGFEKICERLEKRNQYLEASHQAILGLFKLLEVE